MYVSKKIPQCSFDIRSFRSKIEKKITFFTSRKSCLSKRKYLYVNFCMWSRFIILSIRITKSAIYKGIYKVNMLLWRITYFLTCLWLGTTYIQIMLARQIDIHTKHRTFAVYFAPIRLHQLLFSLIYLSTMLTDEVFTDTLYNRQGVPRLQELTFTSRDIEFRREVEGVRETSRKH